MYQYLDILDEIITSDYTLTKSTRTGVDTLSLTGPQFQHDMRTGFPLVTTKKMGMKSISAELEFFIKGLSDKKWLQDRGCHIWDEWANPKKVEQKLNEINLQEDEYKNTPRDGRLFSNTDMSKNEFRKVLQISESDLGRIYGVQWRNWRDGNSFILKDFSLAEAKTYDQLKDVIERAKKNPLDRRLLVTAWRPDELDQMALPPCHYSWQILSDGKVLDLIFNIRSWDFFLGGPYNIASYGLLLLLLSKELNLTPRLLFGNGGDVHLYKNHIEQAKEQLSRTPYELPTLTIPDENWTNIFEWEYTDIILENYECHPKIKAEIAV